MANELDALNANHQNQIPKTKPNYLIDRDVLKQENVIQQSGYMAPDKSIQYCIRSMWDKFNFYEILLNFIPILKWLPKYSIKDYLICDIISGCTIAVMHIPHGLAYSVLAGVTPEVGLYMAIFPVIGYLILGTSKHISIGTFAVISMMTLKVVQNHATSPDDINDSEESVYTPLEVVTALAMTTGIIHVFLGFLRAGALASLLSDPLINGFTTGAACHVVTSQLKYIFGVKVQRYKGAFKIAYTIFDICSSIPKANAASIIVSIIIFILMVVMNEYVKFWLAKKCRIPLPVELMMVAGSIIASEYLYLNENYNIHIIGEIPTGLPAPSVPKIELFPKIFFEALSIAIVSYSVAISMGIIFANKQSYEISPNQELLALGISNIFSSFWSCIPLGCSLSRSLIQEKTGGITQIASLVSTILIINVLLFLGPFFKSLPMCVLAAVVIVSLKGMFVQIKDVSKYIKQGKLEFFAWLITFLGVIIIDIDIGLLMGIFVSIITFYLKGMKPCGSLVGTLYGQPTGIYVDLKNHRSAIEIPNIKIYRYYGAINFATRNSFKQKLFKAIHVNCEKLRRASIGMHYVDKCDNKSGDYFSILILDLSSCSHLDHAGCKIITEIMKNLQILDIRLFLAAPSDCVYDALMRGMTLNEGPFEILPTVHDTVLYAEACLTA